MIPPSPEHFYRPCPGAGAKPSCCNILNWSSIPQYSITLPSLNSLHLYVVELAPAGFNKRR